MGMLRQGAAYVEQDHIPGVRFTRAKVEALPFPDALFDAAICSGSLHLFADTALALREIGRPMKAGAPLAVMTFVAGNRGILRFRWVREHVERDHGAHVFEISELKEYLAQAGCDGFRPQPSGSPLCTCRPDFWAESHWPRPWLTPWFSSCPWRCSSAGRC